MNRGRTDALRVKEPASEPLRSFGTGPSLLVLYLAGLILIQLLLVGVGRRYPSLPC
jgi:hypothetical protein